MIEYGMKSFKWKAIGGDTLESLGKILGGTAKFYGDAPSTQQFYAAQNPSYPALSLTEKAGLTKIEFTLMEIDADVEVKLFRGTATGVAPNKSYAAPRDTVDIHGSAELISDSGLKITVPKAHLVANFDWNLSRTAVSNIKVLIVIELPDDEDDMPYTIAREA